MLTLPSNVMYMHVCMYIPGISTNCDFRVLGARHNKIGSNLELHLPVQILNRTHTY
jgi:hypothetical protein